jgi:type IV pilus assembly protein PilM
LERPAEHLRSLFGKRLRRSIGLDLGSSTVKAVEITLDGREAALTGMACGIRRPDEELGETVGRVLGDGRFRGREVTVAVAGRSVVVRYVSMPKAPEADLRLAMPFEAERLLPFNLEEMRLDCQVLGPRRNVAGELTDEVNVLLAACRRDEIDERLSLVRNRGLSPRAVDVDLFAVINAWERARTAAEAVETQGDEGAGGEETVGDRENPSDRSGVALVDIGSQRSTVSVLADGIPCFSREIGMGGADMTQALARALGLGTEEAEILKRDPGEREEEVRAATAGVLEDIGNELSHSLDYVEHHEGVRVEVVRVSGGGSLAPGVLAWLEEVIARSVLAWDPLAELPVAEDAAGVVDLDLWRPSLAVALGLAWRGLER